MSIRRLRKPHAELDITAFLNLIVVLVPFLLSTAVFTRLSILELSLPAQSSGVERLKTDNLQLEVVIRPEALEVGDRIGGLIERVPNTPNNGPDTKALGALLQQIKAKFPDKNEATVLAEPNTSYDVLVHVMDAMRATHTVEGAKIVRAELFPQISVGDAPVRVVAGGRGS